MAEHTEAGVEWTAADVDRMISMRRVETDEKRELKRTLLAGDLTGAGVEWTAADVDSLITDECYRARMASYSRLAAAVESSIIRDRAAAAKATAPTESDSAATANQTYDDELTRPAELAAAMQTPERIRVAARELLARLTTDNVDIVHRTGERRYTVQVSELTRATAHLQPAVGWDPILVNLAIGEINRQFPDMVLVQEPARVVGQVLITAVPAHLLAPRSYTWHATYEACGHDC